MRFFTASLWAALQQPEQAGENIRKWEQAFRDYGEQLAPLGNRLNPESFSFFSEADVHDGELVEFRIIPGTPSMNHPVGVALAVMDAAGQFVWHLSYSAVRHVIVDYPGKEPLFYQDGEGFGDWGYHELTDAGDGFLRHEILFASGSILAVEFREVAVRKTPRDQ
jgi:hypothetical protein